jgi:hypothetical protein
METTQARPRFRQDLVAEPIDEQGARYIDVIDPDSGNTFRFYEVEYSIACAMDGERDVEGLVRWAQEELGLSPSATEVKSVIATLGDLGYLEAALAEAALGHPGHAVGAAGAEHELAHGVVVGERASTELDGDLELGSAGGAAPAAAETFDAPDMALGAPGRSTGPALSLEGALEDIPLGASGAGATEAMPAIAEPPAVPEAAEVSLDLSEGLSIGADDVKEAVRASRVMTAVEVPADLLDQIEPTLIETVPVAPTAAAKVEAKAEPKAEPKVEAKAEPKVEAKAEPKAEPKAAAKPVEAKPEVRATGRSKPEAKPPVELPKHPVAAKVEAPAASAAKKGPSAPLVVLLVLVLVGAAVFLVWKYVLNKEDDGAPVTSMQPVTPTPAVGSAAVTPPPPPPAPAVKLVKEDQTALEIKPLVVGQIAELAAADKAVKAGEVVARMVGFKPLADEVAALQQDVDKRLPGEISAAEKERDDATAAGNKAAADAADAKVAERRKKLDTKQAALSAKQSELDKYVLKASGEGKVVQVAKVGARVTAEDVILKLARTPALTARFELPAGKSFSVDSSIQLVVKGSDQKANCTVAALEQGQLKILCPIDPALPEGTEVTLVAP